MSTSPPPSVFKSLGSYADRIGKTSNGQVVKSPPPNSSPSQSTPAQSSSMSASASTTNTASVSASTTKVSTPQTPAEGVEVQVDDGPWETVKIAKAKGKQDKQDKERDHVDKGSNSRNWRDRPQREKAGESSKDGQSEKKASSSVGAGSNKGKKGSSSAAATSSVSTLATRSSSDNGKSQSVPSTSRTAPTTSTAPPSKPAWGLSASKSATNATSTSTDPVPTAKPTGKADAPAKTNTAPATPAINGNTATTAVPVDSPAETSVKAGSSSNTSAAKSNKEVKEKEAPAPNKDIESIKKEEPKAKAEVSTPAPVPAPRVAAPPTNPWNTRKPVLASPAIITSAASSEPKQSARIQFGQLSPSAEASNPLPNGHANGHSEEPVTIGGKKKKKDSPVAIDASQWPDVAQAQVVKSDVKKEVKTVDESQEEPLTGKKPKWKAIPASELLAAADEAAAIAAAATEAKQRAERKRGKGESSKSPIDKTTPLSAGGKTRKGDGKRSEIRLPPNPSQGPRSSFKPTFGSVESELGEAEVFVNGNGNGNGHASAPLSRQTSRASKRGSSPSRSAILPSSTSDSAIPLEHTMRFGNGPLKGQNQNASAPLLQQPFVPSTSSGLPRPPRGGRASFSGGRGRGGHRNRNGFDPNLAAGQYYYGQAGQGQYWGQQPMFDPMQAQSYNMQMYGRGPMPPPPQPQTVVPGLNMDPLRFYVLGQVEYYFSMQNLAMDFFLRQQMDTEGWISIPMIASFNRIKSLTPEVPLVKEMMELSSLLEVQGEHVRITGEDAKKWVLPDAKASPFPPSTSITPATASVSDTLEDSSMSLEDSTAVSVAESGVSLNPENAFDMRDMGFGTELKYQPDEVKAALMKSGSGMGAAQIGGGEKEVLVDEKVNGKIGHEDEQQEKEIEAASQEKQVEVEGIKAD